MRKGSYIVAAALVVLALTGCDRTQPIYNVEHAPIQFATKQKITAEQVGALIAKTATTDGWVVTRTKPGVMHAVLSWRDFSASVDIRYTDKDYSILHDTSKNLYEENGKIHGKYNQRVRKLQNEIDLALSKYING